MVITIRLYKLQDTIKKIRFHIIVWFMIALAYVANISDFKYSKIRGMIISILLNNLPIYEQLPTNKTLRKVINGKIL
jgi:hypothetical protein